MKVPLFAKIPDTRIVPDGAVSVPETVRLLNAVNVDPLICEDPSKVTVPRSGVNVPLFIQLPAQYILDAPIHVMVALLEIEPATSMPAPAEMPICIVPPECSKSSVIARVLVPSEIAFVKPAVVSFLHVEDDIRVQLRLIDVKYTSLLDVGIWPPAQFMALVHAVLYSPSHVNSRHSDPCVTYVEGAVWLL
jgi:hypothetical protein